LEATIQESNGKTVGFITDAFGNTLATTPLWNQVNWTAMRFGAFGPVDGFLPPSVSGSITLADASLYRSKPMDPTWQYCFGTRYLTSHGNWTSFDSIGFDGRGQPRAWLMPPVCKAWVQTSF
jgi:hypothetical protein